MGTKKLYSTKHTTRISPDTPADLPHTTVLAFKWIILQQLMQLHKLPKLLRLHMLL